MPEVLAAAESLAEDGTWADVVWVTSADLLWRAARARSGYGSIGQVGDVDDLYRYFGIDSATIVGAAWDLIDEAGLS